jgi:hypothetical protein
LPLPGFQEPVERWAFFVDWYDANASLTRTYTLIYYPSSKEVEMVRQERSTLPEKEQPDRLFPD